MMSDRSPPEGLRRQFGPKIVPSGDDEGFGDFRMATGAGGITDILHVGSRILPPRDWPCHGTPLRVRQPFFGDASGLPDIEAKTKTSTIDEIVRTRSGPRDGVLLVRRSFESIRVSLPSVPLLLSEPWFQE